MLFQTPSQLFKSEIRGKIETKAYKCLSTFNYLNYQEESRKSFGNLTIFNDETLASGECVKYFSEENQTIVLLPLVGALEVFTDNCSEFIDVNQIKIFSLKEGTSFEISNPYEKDLINFLQIRFSSDDSNSEVTSFELETKKNEITNLTTTKSFSISIGIFDARWEDNHKLMNEKLFSFVINGAFEFQNRLLENRDGLKIWDIDAVTFEALSENAILLIIDVLY